MKKRDPRIPEWIALLQRNWMRIRTYAARRYREDGRGTFFVALKAPVEDAALDQGDVTYRSTRECEDDEERALHGELVNCYNPEREISVVFYDTDGEHATTRGMILKEYPDGTPAPTHDERHDRWCGRERTCPRCGHVFISLDDHGECSACGHEFKASDDEYRRRKSSPIDPIGRYELPSEPPADYEALCERVRELHIRDGIEGLGPNEKLVELSEQLYAEVFNGGWKQYFGNSAGNHAADLLELLSRRGEFRMRSILAAACEPFPDRRPSPDRAVRFEQLKALDEATWERHEMLSSRFLNAYEDYDDFRRELWEQLRNRFAPGGE